MKSIIFIIFALMGAGLYRWRGVSNQGVVHPTIQILFTFPFALYTFYHAHMFFFSGERWPYAAAAIAWAVALAATLTGHGNGQDLGTAPRGKPERLEYLILWLEPYLPAYWYDALLLLVIGCATVGATVALTANPYFSLVAFAAPLGYMIGRLDLKFCNLVGLTATEHPLWIQSPTDFGEWWYGMLFWSFIALAVT